MTVAAGCTAIGRGIHEYSISPVANTGAQLLVPHIVESDELAVFVSSIAVRASGSSGGTARRHRCSWATRCCDRRITRVLAAVIRQDRAARGVGSS